MEIELPKDFREFFELLNANEVRYLVIGGYAVGIYGYSRTTNDLDVFLADDPENKQRLAQALYEFGFGKLDANVDLFPESRSMVEIGVEPIMIQLMNFADGLEFEESYARRRDVDTEGLSLHVLSKDDLIANKIASGRLKDLADVERLKRMD